MKIEQYLAHTDYALWEVILNGKAEVQMTKDEASNEVEVSSVTAQQILARTRERKAKSTLLMAILDEHLAIFHGIKDAKTLWAAIKTRFGGSSRSSLNSHNVAFVSAKSTSSTNELSAAYSVSTATCHSSQAQGSSSYADELMFLFFANQSSSPQLDNKDLEKIDQDDLDCRTVRNPGNRGRDAKNVGYRGRDNSKSPARKEDEKALVVQDGLEEEVTKTVFDNRLSDEENSLANDRFKKGKGFHAVPSPLTRNYMPPKPNLSFVGLDGSIYKFKISETVTSLSKDVKDAPETSTAFVEKPTEVRTSDNDSVFRPKHIPAKINFVRVESSISVRRPKSKDTKSKDRVLTNTNDKRPSAHVQKMSSSVSMDFNKHETMHSNVIQPNTSVLNTKIVNAVNDSLNILCVSRVSVVKGNGVTAVKASACCVWRPRVNEIDQISKDNRWICTCVDYGHPQQALKNKGIVDSGCSRHMTENKAYLADYQEINDRGFVAFGSSIGKITGKGKIRIEKLDFDDLLDESQVLLRIPKQSNMYSFDLQNGVPSGDLTCLFAKASIDESNLWHMSLGHVNFKTMNKLVNGNLVRGLPSKIFENDHTYVTCQKEKQHKATLTDNFSRFSWVFFLATKDETSKVLKSFITAIENQINKKAKIIRCDNGPEFKNRDLDEFCEMKGIKREYSNARTPQQDRVTERKNRTLIEAARTMLADSLWPITFWAEAVNTACYILNRALVTKPHNKTPYELLNGRSSRLDFMRPFGCLVTILKTVDPLGKFEGTQDNVDAGKKVSDQDHIMLPLWFSISYTYKSSDDKAEDDKPKDDTGSKTVVKQVNKEDQAYREELDRLMSQEKDASDAADSLSKEFKQGCMDQRGAAKAGSTNSFNTVINPINAAKADFNNMESSTIVSPIPIHRVHIDHPKDQILGDPQSAVQTRGWQRKMEPKKVAQALDDESWVEAMQDELLQFSLQKVWRLVDLPYGKKNLRTKWVYMNKKDEKGIVVRNKARLVAQGHRQEEWIDYDVVFAPMARIEAIRIFLAFVSFMGFIVYQMDVNSAFLYGTIEEEVYISQPPSFIDPHFPNKVYKVEKALYDLHQAPRACTPIETQKPLVKDKEAADVDVHLYRSMIGSLMYLIASRPDIMFAVYACSRFQVTPKLSHLHAVKRIFRRLISWQCKKQTVVATSATEAEDSYEKKLIQVLKIHTEDSVADLLTKSFNVSRFIFDGMWRDLDGSKKKFLMYPRFLQIFMKNQIPDLVEPLNDVYVTPTLTKNVSSNLIRKSEKFSRTVTLLFASMLAQSVVVEGEGSRNAPESQPTPSPAQPISESQILESSSSPQNTQSPRQTL
nr:retrotransposon protein, putative, unclassified [Tanacetum cinerariifolium]